MSNSSLAPHKSSVSSMMQRLHRKYRLHSNDSESVKLLIAVLKRHPQYYVWHQEEDDSNTDPEKKHYILVVATITSLRKAYEFGKYVVGFDATYNVSDYGFPLWLVTGRDNYGSGYPLAFAMSGHETITVQKVILRQIRIAITAQKIQDQPKIATIISPWTPEAFVIDKCEASYQVF